MSSSSRTAAILRLFPSLTDVAFLTPALLMLTRPEGLNMLLGDGDTGWHIRAGEWILANGRVPQTDMFSFTRSGEPWFAWEWLADIVMAAMHLRFGMAGVMFLSVVLLGLTSALLFRLCRRHTNNDLLAMAFTFLASAASSIHWLARPHLFTFVFLVISLHLLERAAENRKLLWVFPPMVALWTNLHGAFFISIILLGAAGTGRFLQVILAPEENGLRAAWNDARTYYAVAAASAGASLANPYGWHLHQHIVKYLSENFHFDNISEFQSLSFHAPAAKYFEILVVFGLMAAAWSLSRRRYTDVLLILGWLHLGLMAGRNIPIFAIVTAPLATRFVSEALTALREAEVAPWLRRAAAAIESYTAGISRMDRMPRFYLPSLAGAAVLFILMLGAPVGAKKIYPAFDPERYPAGALALLDGKRVFTDDEWGDYLIYKLYPKLKVFVDGRSDFYGPVFCQNYLDVMKVRWNWAEMLTRHGVDAVLLPVDSPLAATLKSTSGWQPVYDDHRAILFFASGARPQAAPVSAASLGPSSDAKSDPRSGSPDETAQQPNPKL